MMEEYIILLLFVVLNILDAKQDAPASDVAKYMTKIKRDMWHLIGAIEYLAYIILMWVWKEDWLLIVSLVSLRFVVFNPAHNLFREAKINFFHLGEGYIDSFGKKFTEKGWWVIWLLILIGSIVIKYI